VITEAIDVGSFFHGFALGAAVLAGRCGTGTNWVRALLGIFSSHFFFSYFSDFSRI
jgi:hypothetical protein